MADLNQAELKEIASLRQKAIEMLGQVQVMFHTNLEGLIKNDIRILDQVLKDEEKVTEIYNSLTASAIETSKKKLSKEAKDTIMDLMNIIGAIERAGDSCVSLVEQIEYKVSEKLRWSETAVQEYKDLHSKVEKALSDTVEVMKTKDEKLAKEILDSKSTLYKLVDKYRASHIDRSARGICCEWAKVRYLDMLGCVKEIARRCMEIVNFFA